MASASSHLIAFCPYLPLSGPLVFGPWTIAPLSDGSVAFADGQLERAARLLLSRLVTDDGVQIGHPAILWANGSPIDGANPAATDLRTLDAALRFAAYDNNPRRVPGGDDRAHGILTADHGEVFLWPIDAARGEITVTRGSDLLRARDGGWRVCDEALEIRAPAEVILPQGTVRLQEDLLTAVVTVAGMAQSGGGAMSARASQLLTAIEWCNKAWLNSGRFTLADRVVMLKVGFEALTTSDRSHLQAVDLIAAFNRLGARGGDPGDELLWQPVCAAQYPRVRPRTSPPVTDHLEPFAHWYMAFSDCRNDIIHQGASATQDYVNPGSAFEGSFFWVGEWMLRKTIKVVLEEFGFSGLWQSAEHRFWNRLRALAEGMS